MTDMSQLADARLDVICCHCNQRPSVTRDRRFCKQCLTLLLREINPTGQDLNRRGSESYGRFRN